MTDAVREALKRALLICGGSRALCARLGVGAAKLQAWLDGEAMPAAQLAKVIEILVSDYDAWRAQDRRSEPRQRARATKRTPAGIV